MRPVGILTVLWAVGAAAAPVQVTVGTAAADILNRFSPDTAIGAGVDGVPYPSVREIYTSSNVRQMLGAGLGAVSYRLYTELSVQDWHWNPAGAFSETSTQGYWTSTAVPSAPTVDTFGYRLPRRGFTHDQGNDDDFSRIDDGDPATFWKSSPYLSAAYTGEPDTAHPQWVLFDMGAAKTVNAAQILWAAPYATQYAVQYWTGDDPIYDPAHGAWASFPTGSITAGTGGSVTLSLGTAGRAYRYYRIVMTASSGTCTRPASIDRRDCLGYAIAEAGLGTLDASGAFTDLVRHSPDQRQTVTYASSVDPWHRDADRVRNQEQPGLDTVFGSGLTRGLPATVPVPMLYSTPENAAAEIAYLEARHDSIAQVEMGEEPDGQFITPEDYATLYLQFARALYAVDPRLVLGGPVFEDNSSDLKAWPNAAGETSWTKRFVAYLAAHGQLGKLGFFSFEHYPFGACGSARTQANLLREPDVVDDIVDTWRADNLPPGLPIYITETSYASHETDATQQPAGAIWTADLIGTALSRGVNGIFLYEYEPIPLSRSNPCPGWGSYGMLLGDRHYTAQAPLSQYFVASMLTRLWAQPGVAPTTLFGAKLQGGGRFVTAYPVRRPDGTWSVLLVNRDLAHPHEVRVSFGFAGNFAGNVTQTVFGAAQYGWVEDGPKSHPQPDGPPVTTQQPGGAEATYTLPTASITVLNGSIR